MDCRDFCGARHLGFSGVLGEAVVSFDLEFAKQNAELRDESLEDVTRL